MDMRNTARLVANAAAAQREKIRAAGYKGQYVFKYDDGDFHYKLTADLTNQKAVVTQSVIYGPGEDPEVTVFELAADKDGKVYPLGMVGCPSDVFVYSFTEFTCKNARNFKMYFSKNAEDLGGTGSKAHFMGFATFELESFDLIYPCTRT